MSSGIVPGDIILGGMCNVLRLSGVMIFLAIFSFSAEKRLNRMIFGVSALCADIILACTTLPMLLSNVPHEGLSIVYNLGITSYLFYLAIAVACSVSVTYNAVKLRAGRGSDSAEVLS